MPEFECYEVFYSRVESAYSLRNRGGYQIVYHSPELPADTVKDIEKHLRCFKATDVDTRHQYFQLPNDSVGLAMSREIDQIDTQITDRSGRRGPFVGHCLVFDRQAFLQMENDPFYLFESMDAFVLDVPSMIETQKNQPATRTVYVEFPLQDDEEDSLLDDYMGFNIEGWQEADFLSLWQAAADASQIRQDDKVLALRADENITPVYELLRLIIRHLPLNDRLHCTFNTFIDDCRPPAGAYWATGGFRPVRLPGTISVRLDRCRTDYHAAMSGSTVGEIGRRVYKKLRDAQGLNTDDDV